MNKSPKINTISQTIPNSPLLPQRKKDKDNAINDLVSKAKHYKMKS